MDVLCSLVTHTDNFEDMLFDHELQSWYQAVMLKVLT